MKSSPFLQFLLGALIILVMESVPFIYNEAYTLKDIKWGWVVGFPLAFLVMSSLRKSEEKK